jgi:CPA2 family monovalent cation:H+ antiporter-2
MVWNNAAPMETYLLHDLAVVIAAAAVMSLLCQRFRQPVVIGYILTGLLIGPYTPPFALVKDLHSIHTMAELGLVLLMFSLGLEFNLPKLRRVGPSATVAAGLEIVGMIAIGYGLGRWFGWNATDSLFLGALLSISSTTIIVKVFGDSGMTKETFTQVVFGILVLEDVAAVVILSVLSGLGLQGGPAASASAFIFPIVKVVFFVILFLVIGLLTVPPFLRWVGRFHVKEVLGISCLGLCFVGSMLAAHFQLSLALGAFLAGAVIAASEELPNIEDWVHPVKDMFSVLFFVSAGMLIQPRLLLDHFGAIMAVTAATIVGKALTGGVGTFLAGYDIKTSARVGMSLSQIGEFSFVIASLGLTLNVTSDFLYPIAIVVSALTTLTTPYLIRNSDRLIDTVMANTPKPILQSLQRYHEQIQRLKDEGRSAQATAILSKYLIRLIIYATLLSAMFLIAVTVSELINFERLTDDPVSYKNIALWTSAALLALPLTYAVSKYLNHLLLLLISSRPRLLRFIDVHFFYNVLNYATVAVIYAGFAWLAYLQMPSIEILLMIGLFLFLVSRAMRRRLKRAVETLEELMDQVVGLATSDPTRQAVMASGDKKLLLYDVTDQFRLQENSPAVGQTIRSLKLREQSGCSIVAIYRDGKHIANPSPDMTFLVNDVLILLGEEEQLTNAKSVLAS